MEPHDIPPSDWELSEDYYQNEKDRPELKLEDFMDNDDSDFNEPSFKSAFSEQNQRLNRIIEDVHHVLALAKDGETIQEIAVKLNLDPQYVYDIQISAQGFREDDEIAVARLVEMSL